MEAGIADPVWEIEELVARPDEQRGPGREREKMHIKPLRGVWCIRHAEQPRAPIGMKLGEFSN